MDLEALNKVAQAMTAPGKGILAADEVYRHDQEAVRRHRRGIDRGQPPRLSRDAVPRRRGMRHISGVILYDETIRQKAKDGTPLVELIKKAGSIPGIKVDKGTKPLPICPGEMVTEGLDKLRRPPAEVLRAGRAFREVARGHRDRRAGMPSYTCISANAHALARYAALCQAGRHRADRRARGADGRRSRHRPLP